MRLTNNFKPEEEDQILQSILESASTLFNCLYCKIVFQYLRYYKRSCASGFAGIIRNSSITLGIIVMLFQKSHYAHMMSMIAKAMLQCVDKLCMQHRFLWIHLGIFIRIEIAIVFETRLFIWNISSALILGCNRLNSQIQYPAVWWLDFQNNSIKSNIGDAAGTTHYGAR